MKDYKNLKVHKSYRARENRTYVKRTYGSRALPRPSTGALFKIVTFIMLASTGFLLWQAYQAMMRADIFVVAGVDVKGVKRLGERDIREIVAIFTGQNIFRVDLAAAVKRAEGNPWIREARIYRRLPNRITMVFTERVPTTILETNTGRYLMDEEGMVLERLPKDQTSVWPLPVVAIKDCRVQIGENVTADGLPEAVQLINEIAARGGWKVSELTIKADSPDSLTAVYAGYQFKIGHGRYSQKLRRLAEIMADVKDRRLEIAYIDLRPERQAAVMVKKGKVLNYNEKKSKLDLE